MRRSISVLGFASAVLFATLAAGCKKDKEKEQAPESAASVGEAPAPSVPAKDSAVCEVVSQQQIAKNANRRTGLTVTRLSDGRHAVGIAVGNRPQVVVFDPSGQGTVHRVAVKEGSELSKRADGKSLKRDLQRVTATLRKSGNIRAFADYRDKHANKRRRIACGAVESGKQLLEFDGTPLLDRKPSDKSDKKVDPKGPGATRLETKQRKALRLRLPGAALTKSKKPAPAPPPKKEEKPEPENDEPLREVRDCRTFVDGVGKDIWAVGSALVGERNGSDIEWSMELFVKRSMGGSEQRLHSVKLGKDPKKLHTFEAPVAQTLADASTVLAARYRGSLMVFTLDRAKKRKSRRTYREGYPSLPQFEPDGMDHLMMLSQKGGEERWSLGLVRFVADKAVLPGSLSRPDVDVGQVSLAEPSLARQGKQRWLSFHGGDRRRGELYVVPVDENLSSIGKAHRASPEGARIYESRLIGLEGDRLLVVYVTNPERGGAEVVSQVLSCKTVT